MNFTLTHDGNGLNKYKLLNCVCVGLLSYNNTPHFHKILLKTTEKTGRNYTGTHIAFVHFGLDEVKLNATFLNGGSGVKDLFCNINNKYRCCCWGLLVCLCLLVYVYYVALNSLELVSTALAANRSSEKRNTNEYHRI